MSAICQRHFLKWRKVLIPRSSSLSASCQRHSSWRKVLADMTIVFIVDEFASSFFMTWCTDCTVVFSHCRWVVDVILHDMVYGCFQPLSVSCRRHSLWHGVRTVLLFSAIVGELSTSFFMTWCTDCTVVFSHCRWVVDVILYDMVYENVIFSWRLESADLADDLAVRLFSAFVGELSTSFLHDVVCWLDGCTQCQ